MRDGGQVCVDWAVQTTTTLSVKQAQHIPLVVILHGLTGGSDEIYVRSVCAQVVSQGWRCAVYNYRGCASSAVKTPRVYCAASSDDVAEVMAHLKRTALSPGTPVLAVGFSLGANILTKYLGEVGSNTPVTGAVVLCNGFHLAHTCSRLPLLFQRVLAGNLRHHVERHAKLFQDLPEINWSAVQKVDSVLDFDDKFTRVMFGYSSVHEYYIDASSAGYLAGVAVPLLCLNTDDDPISVRSAVDEKRCSSNSNIILATTKYGGHVGWCDAFFGAGRHSCWSDRVCVQFFTAVLRLRG